MTAAPSTVSPWQGQPYTRSAAVLTFALTGTPAPQGSKSYKGQSRSGRAIMVESSKSLKPWRTEVTKAITVALRTTAAPTAAGWPLLGPVGIDLVFTVPRPKSAPKTRRTWPIVKPDVDKLARAVLDAGTFAGLWGDDSQVVDLHPFKVYPSETPRALRVPGLYATVFLIDAHVTVPAVQTQLEVTQ